MKLIEFKPSDIVGKKYMVIVQDNKGKNHTLHFGSKGYEDYTIHKDDERKERYLDRHKSREDWTNPLTAGFWARWVLWNKPTIKESLEDAKRLL